MSILRNEIPQPLDVNFMLDCISNPNLGSFNNLINQRTTKSAINQSTKNQTLSLISMVGTSFTDFSKSNIFNIPRSPPLFNTQTNDGTTCVYYPNGQLAILKANVFGFHIENSKPNKNKLILIK